MEQTQTSQGKLPEARLSAIRVITDDLIHMLQSNRFIGFIKNGLLLLGEISMFILFVIILILILAIPTDPLVYTFHINDSISITEKIHFHKVSEFIIIVKVIFFILSIPWLIVGFLLHRHRRKNLLLKSISEKVEIIRNELN